MNEYTVYPPVPDDVDEHLQIYPAFLRKLLYTRGITDGASAERFIKPDIDRDIHDPFLLHDIEKAVDRIVKAVEGGEKIMIFTDYDHDGIPGGVILRSWFDEVAYRDVDVVIPHRNTEGFGLKPHHIEQAHKNGVKLVITVDCGITAVEAVIKARELGIDLIITDHHLEGDVLPDAHAIINPNKKDDTYPYKHLSGSGVAYKVVEALVSNEYSRARGISERWEKELLDLVAIATIGDMVSLTGENRALVYEGLKRLRKTQRVGLQALIDKTKLNPAHISEDDVSFMIVPRINAASRMDAPEDAFNLLAAETKVEAEKLVHGLNDLNDARKTRVGVIVKEARKRINARDADSPVFVVGDTSWQQGLLGLVANSVMDGYKRPVCVWGGGVGETLHGSCRTPKGIDLSRIMAEIPEGVFDDVGGHANAGGFSTTKEHIYTLENVLSDAYTRVYGKDAPEAEPLVVDEEIQLRDITWETYAHIELCAPYGIGNPKPVFLLRDVIVKNVKWFGSDKQHLELTLTEGTHEVSAIQFFAHDVYGDDEIQEGIQLQLAATIEKSVFRGRPELRLRIVDINIKIDDD